MTPDVLAWAFIFVIVSGLILRFFYWIGRRRTERRFIRKSAAKSAAATARVPQPVTAAPQPDAPARVASRPPAETITDAILAIINARQDSGSAVVTSVPVSKPQAPAAASAAVTPVYVVAATAAAAAAVAARTPVAAVSAAAAAAAAAAAIAAKIASEREAARAVIAPAPAAPAPALVAAAIPKPGITATLVPANFQPAPAPKVAQLETSASTAAAQAELPPAARAPGCDPGRAPGRDLGPIQIVQHDAQATIDPTAARVLAAVSAPFVPNLERVAATLAIPDVKATLAPGTQPAVAVAAKPQIPPDVIIKPDVNATLGAPVDPVTAVTAQPAAFVPNHDRVTENMAKPDVAATVPPGSKQTASSAAAADPFFFLNPEPAAANSATAGVSAALVRTPSRIRPATRLVGKSVSKTVTKGALISTAPPSRKVLLEKVADPETRVPASRRPAKKKAPTCISALNPEKIYTGETFPRSRPRADLRWQLLS